MMDDRITDEPPEPDPWQEGPPWKLPGGFRFDGEPHRGPLLFDLGQLSLMIALLGVLPMCFLCSAPVAIPLGLRVWIMARRDLALMHRGEMDTRGREDTELGRKKARWALVLALTSLLLWGVVFSHLVRFWD
jgi:hypothetical protein